MRLRNCTFIFVPIFLIFETICFVASRPQFSTVLEGLPAEIHENLDNHTQTILKIFGDILEGKNETESRILNRRRGQAKPEVQFGEKSDIIFPDDPIIAKIPKLTEAPECADSTTYCEKIDVYPHLHVQEILQHKNVHQDLFGKDEFDDKILISNRFADDDEFVCTGVQKTIFPKVGKNKNNKWKFIINQEDSDKYYQGVMVEVCKREGSPCKVIGDIPDGYTTSCKQKYILRKLMSISDAGEPIPDSFQLPSACCCAYRKDLNFLSRSGFGVTPVARERYFKA